MGVANDFLIGFKAQLVRWHPYLELILFPVGINTETYTSTHCKAWEALDHLVLNGMTSSNPSFQSSVNYAEEDAVRL